MSAKPETVPEVLLIGCQGCGKTVLAAQLKGKRLIPASCESPAVVSFQRTHRPAKSSDPKTASLRTKKLFHLQLARQPD